MYDSTAIRPTFDSHSTVISLRYDRSTTCITTVGLPEFGLLHCDLNEYASVTAASV